jgi:hypothetical protein
MKSQNSSMFFATSVKSQQMGASPKGKGSGKRKKVSKKRLHEEKKMKNKHTELSKERKE